MFSVAKFIKADYLKADAYPNDYAPIFCSEFDLVKQDGKKITLDICALGIGYAYVNGKAVSDDLFCAPVSDYRKTLWCNSYDVTDLLSDGKNVISIILGNGFYNENFPSGWSFDKAAWRDIPKVIAEIKMDDKVVVGTNDEWKVIKNTFITFNQYRSGERFDARLYDENWQTNCVNTALNYAVIDDNPPSGKFMPYEAKPVQETQIISPVKLYELFDGTITVDFGINVAGYVGINAIGNVGDKITLEYAEDVDEDGNLKLNELNCYAPLAPFQTCEIICAKKPVFYKPRFTYFGFRYVHVTGLKGKLEKYQITAYRVGNTAERIGFFECSDEFLNKLHDCSENSVRSNLMHNLTDCPTREKLGWMNDAASSCEHIYYLYDVHTFFEKWMRDIADMIKSDGSLSGIAPTPDWGYDFGPVCDWALFEIPHQDYIFTGDDGLLKKYLSHCEKYLRYLNSDHNCKFLLADWMGCGNKSTSSDFVIEVITARFYQLLLPVKKDEQFRTEFNERVSKIKEKYILKNGECKENTQTAISMLIYFGYYDELEPLKNQLKKVTESNDFHLDVGLLGNKFIWLALDKCDLNDYALKIIKVKGMPSYDFWLSDGATSLYENWTKTGTVSLNHHMYSAVNVYSYKVLGGIRYLEPQNGEPIIEINPHFAKDINYVKCQTKTLNGEIKVEWQREDGKIRLTILVGEKVNAVYKGKKLPQGKSVFYQ